MFSLHKKTEDTGLNGVSWQGEMVALAHVRRAGEIPELDVCEVLDANDPNDALAAAVETHALRGSPCVMVVPEDAYSLRVVNAPDVEPEELAEAARWLVKDLIEFDLEDVEIDVLQIPVDSGWTREKKIYVLAVQGQALRIAIARIESAGLTLVSVEIREHALLSAAGSMSSARGTAVLQISGKNGVLSIGDSGHLYVVHPVHLDPDQLEVGWENDALDPDATVPYDVDHLLLEIQRSLDFYESEFGRSPVSRLLIAPSDAEVSSLVPYLQHNLTVDVQMFDFADRVACEEFPPHAAQANSLTALGAALSDREGGALQLERIFQQRRSEPLDGDAIVRLIGIFVVLLGLWYAIARRRQCRPGWRVQRATNLR